MNKIVYGITGSLGSGKSFISEQIKLSSHQKIKIIEIDDIRRYILWSSIESKHIDLRQQLAQAFNVQILDQFSFFERDSFTELIFQSKESLFLYSSIITPVLKEYVEHIINTGKSSYFFIVWAYLIEENYLELLTSSVILIQSDFEKIITRLKNKNEYSAEALNRIFLEPTYQSRIDCLKKSSISFIEINNNIENLKQLNELLITLKLT